jgi:predicted DNA-binding WGR domain protein
MRRFEFVQGTSSKFWATEVRESTFIVVYGRIGTDGQRKEKAFPTAEAARREMEKKIAEKLREGYQEVGAAAAPPPPVKEPEAPPLPPRRRVERPAPEQQQAAARALTDLLQALGSRSWIVQRRSRRALAALEPVAGSDPAQPPLREPFDALMARVVADPGQGRLPLGLALRLLLLLDVSAFPRALAIWHRARRAGLAALLDAQVAALGDPELALRLCALLAERPEHGGSEAGWTRRFVALRPYLQAALKGRTLRDHLQGIDVTGDAHLARRVAAMLAA